MTEFFGPVLAVMRFDKLSEAVALVNQTGYGLTSGLESLDEREWEYWKEHIHAGNLYINRVTTGAVVLRQPFGGIGKSAFGPGMKAGGPNYVAQFMDFTDCAAGKVRRRCPAKQPWPRCASGLRGRGSIPMPSASSPPSRSYDRTCRDEFGMEHDHFRLVGQDNFRRYLPLAKRARPRPCRRTRPSISSPAPVPLTSSAAAVTVSTPPGMQMPAGEAAGGADRVLGRGHRVRRGDRRASSRKAIRRAPGRPRPLCRAGPVRRCRCLQAGGQAGVCVVSAPVSAEGRLELLVVSARAEHQHRLPSLRQSRPRASEERAAVM